MPTEKLITLHTSGTTGAPKEYHARWSSLALSAQRTCQALQLQRGANALLCLPDHYIAGLMMRIRAQVWPLRLLEVTPSRHPLTTVSEHIHFAAMTPMQVTASLTNDTEAERLRSIDNLLIGGAPIDHDLADTLRSFTGNVWHTYAMTETLSNVALRSLAGPNASTWYDPLPGCHVSLDNESRIHLRCLTVEECNGELTTGDLGELHPTEPQRFRVLGRADDIINSGGVKINPLIVEELLRPHLHCPFLICGTPQPLLGQQVTLLVLTGHATEAHIAINAIDNHFLRPRKVVEVEQLPTTESGKPIRKGLSV